MQQQIAPIPPITPMVRAYRGRFHSAKVPSCVIAPSDLRRLYRDLETRTMEALDRFMSEWQFTGEIATRIRQEAHLTVTIHGADGEQIVEHSEAALADSALPERLRLVAYDSAAAVQLMNLNQALPLNRFRVLLDFNEPPRFDSYNPWSQPTPNTSFIEVIGNDETWVTGVYQFIRQFFEAPGRQRRHRAWLHRQRTFNIGNWLIGFPAGLWIVYRVGYYFPVLNEMHPALLGAVYVYVFLFVLLLFRGAVWLMRWLFPVIELAESRSRGIRLFLSSILLGLFVALLYDVLKAFVLH